MWRPTTVANRDVLSAARLNFDEIPIVDLTPLFEPNSEALTRLVESVREICRNIGFFYIKNHRVPTNAINTLLLETERFFRLPLETKLVYDIGKLRRHRGYVPVGALCADPDAEPDMQEAFEVALELPEDDPDYVAGSPIYGPNVWPTELPEFEQDVYSYFEHMLALGRTLFRLFALTLDLPETFYDKEISKPMAQLRLIHYPTTKHRPSASGSLGVGAHTDYECFTILWQKQSGLQVQNPAGIWIEAPPIADTFVINIGDMLQRWTNDLFVSTPHRVINRSDRKRYSFPFFFGTNYETVVKCLEHCCGPDNPPRYPPTKCGYWTENMHTYSYVYRHPDRGKLPDPELSQNL